MEIFLQNLKFKRKLSSVNSSSLSQNNDCGLSQPCHSGLALEEYADYLFESDTYGYFLLTF